MVHAPHQMLALVEDDLKVAMCIDVKGVFSRRTLLGFPAENWKFWRFHDLEVMDLGADLPAEKSIEAVKAGNANIVSLSALLTRAGDSGGCGREIRGRLR
jgi:hypothetical protein